ncbi:MAG: glycosyltransferase [Tenuifilum sp.]|uniref:glycosyltransferase n=1 Tax=Tenuifilum sp. TaxID=2760880 RepID=UPI0030AC5929
MKVLAYIDPMSYNNLEMYDVALLSNNKKFKIYFFCSTKLITQYLNGGVIKRIFNYNDKKGIAKVISYLISMFQLFIFVKFYKINLIHVQWFRLPVFELYYYKLIKLFYPKIKLVHTAHNVLPHNFKEKDKKYFCKLYLLFDSIILHTENSLAEIKKLTSSNTDKFIVIPHGILKYPFSSNDIQKKLNSLDFLHKLENKTVFVSLGSQHYYKGIDILVNVWLDTPDLRNNESIILLIAGKGSIPRIEELVKLQNVIIENKFIDDLTFVTYMSLADVVLLPYRKISQSGVLLTAIGLRKPVLVSDAGGLSDPLKYGKIGWKIRAGDSVSLSEKLKLLVSNRKLIDDVLNNFEGWNNVVKNYEWENIQQKTFQLYEHLLSN